MPSIPDFEKSEEYAILLTGILIVIFVSLRSINVLGTEYPSNRVLLFTGFGDKSAFVKEIVSRNTHVPIAESIDSALITSPNVDDVQHFPDKDIEKWFHEVTRRIWSSTLEKIPTLAGEECQFFDKYVSLSAHMPQKIFHATMGQKNDAWLWYRQVRNVIQCYYYQLYFPSYTAPHEMYLIITP